MKKDKKRKKRRILKFVILPILLLLLLLSLFCIYFLPTLPKNKNVVLTQKQTVGENIYTVGNSWILKNRYGLWEMYVDGNNLERGNRIGALSQDLIIKQEDAFVRQIEEMLPNKFASRFLRFGASVYNRNLGKYIPEENKEEIYAISQYASHNHGRIGNNYQRMMNYHSARDIMRFSGSSALGVWNEKTPDGSLLIGRNFDFYAGDRFSEDKILLFVNPSKGYKHATITWGGMVGVVSGMNEKGLAVVLNAAPSKIPISSATPASIVAREILQYAKNIKEAVAIAEKNKIFISEQFLIGSAEDNKMVSIEKTKNEQIVYSSRGSFLASTNHFQSEKLFDKDAKEKTASGYRMDRINELVDSTSVFLPEDMVALLRDKKGLNGKDIGLGNQKSINQLIAHHGVVFHPATKTMWVSTYPYQDGAFVAYNLDYVFNNAGKFNKQGYSMSEQNIAADSVFISNELYKYYSYKNIINTPFSELNIKDYGDVDAIIKLNRESFSIYEYMGDYNFYKEDIKAARMWYGWALIKEIPTEKQRQKLKEKLKEIEKTLDL